MGKDVNIIINGMSAKRISTIIKNCIHKDMCNSCPYFDKGMLCFDSLMTDAGTALRRMQNKQDKYRQRAEKRIRELEEEIIRLNGTTRSELPEREQEDI